MKIKNKISKKWKIASALIVLTLLLGLMPLSMAQTKEITIDSSLYHLGDDHVSDEAVSSVPYWGYTYTKSFQLDAVPKTDATLSLKVYGTHIADSITINGQNVGGLCTNVYNWVTCTISVPSSYLKRGTNTLSIRSGVSQTIRRDDKYVDDYDDFLITGIKLLTKEQTELKIKNVDYPDTVLPAQSFTVSVNVNYQLPTKKTTLVSAVLFDEEASKVLSSREQKLSGEGTTSFEFRFRAPSTPTAIQLQAHVEGQIDDTIVSDNRRFSISCIQIRDYYGEAVEFIERNDILVQKEDLKKYGERAEDAYGVAFPWENKIVLNAESYEILSPEERKALIAHEACHIERYYNNLLDKEAFLNELAQRYISPLVKEEDAIVAISALYIKWIAVPSDDEYSAFKREANTWLTVKKPNQKGISDDAVYVVYRKVETNKDGTVKYNEDGTPCGVLRDKEEAIKKLEENFGYYFLDRLSYPELELYYKEYQKYEKHLEEEFSGVGER